MGINLADNLSFFSQILIGVSLPLNKDGNNHLIISSKGELINIEPCKDSLDILKFYKRFFDDNSEFFIIYNREALQKIQIGSFGLADYLKINGPGYYCCRVIGTSFESPEKAKELVKLLEEAVTCAEEKAREKLKQREEAQEITQKGLENLLNNLKPPSEPSDPPPSKLE